MKMTVEFFTDEVDYVNGTPTFYTDLYEHEYQDPVSYYSAYYSDSTDVLTLKVKNTSDPTEMICTKPQSICKVWVDLGPYYFDMDSYDDPAIIWDEYSNYRYPGII